MCNVRIVTELCRDSRFSPVGEMKTWSMVKADSEGGSCNHPKEKRWGPSPSQQQGKEKWTDFPSQNDKIWSLVESL